MTKKGICEHGPTEGRKGSKNLRTGLNCCSESLLIQHTTKWMNSVSKVFRETAEQSKNLILFVLFCLFLRQERTSVNVWACPAVVTGFCPPCLGTIHVPRTKSPPRQPLQAMLSCGCYNSTAFLTLKVLCKGKDRQTRGLTVPDLTDPAPPNCLKVLSVCLCFLQKGHRRKAEKLFSLGPLPTRLRICLVPLYHSWTRGSNTAPSINAFILSLRTIACFFFFFFFPL